MRRTHYRRAAIGLSAGIGALVIAAGPALAHVSVSSPDASPGGFGKVVFRVPSESDTASTVKLSVTLPKDTPFAFVSSKVKPGWTVNQQTSKLDEPIEVEGFTVTEAVTKVTWSADKGSGIGPGEFDEFELSVGPFPETTEPLSFPAVQTYSDGEVVNWNQPMNADGSEPEHPTPELTVGEATTDDHSDDTAADPAEEAGAEEEATTDPPSMETPAEDSSTDEAADADSTDSTARGLGIAGLVLAAVAVVGAGVALRRSQSS